MFRQGKVFRAETLFFSIFYGLIVFKRGGEKNNSW